MTVPPAGRSGGADHRRQHADRERRLEGVSGAAVRQHRRPQAVRGHAVDGVVVRAAAARGGAAGGRALGPARVSVQRPARRWSTDRARAARQLHGLGAGRTLHPADRGRAAGQGLPRARRQEPAGRVRRRGPRCRGAGRGAVGVQQRRAALRVRQPHHRLRRRSTTSSGAASSAETAALKVGPGDDDDLGPVINERQLLGILAAVERSRERRTAATLACGGRRLDDRRARGRLLHGADRARERARRTRRSRATRCSGR